MTVEFVEVPIIKSISPRIVPRYIQAPLDDIKKLVITGSGFDSSMTYYCVFKYGFSTSTDVIAEYIDSNTIRCFPINFDYESNVNIQVKVVKNDIYSLGHGTLTIMFYEIPNILNINPTIATYDQENEFSVLIGKFPHLIINLDRLPFIHEVKCKFGTLDASSVKIYTQGKHVICKAPVITSSNMQEEMVVSISIDGANWYEAEQVVTFIATPTFIGVDSQIIPLQGKEYISVLGTNFYDSGTSIACRMKLSAEMYFDLRASFVSSSEIRCLNPPIYLVPTADIELSVTFNRQDYYQVSVNLEYAAEPQVYAIDKFYGVADPVDNIITVTGSGFIDATFASVGSFAKDLEFTPAHNLSGTFELPTFVNISSITGNPYSYECYFDADDDIERYCTSSLTTGQHAW